MAKKETEELGCWLCWVLVARGLMKRVRGAGSVAAMGEVEVWWRWVFGSLRKKKKWLWRRLSAVFWPVQGEEENSKGEGLRGSLPTALGTPKKFKKSPLPCIARDEKK